MSAEIPTSAEATTESRAPGVTLDALRVMVEGWLGKQEMHAVFGRFGVDWAVPYDLGKLLVLLPTGERVQWSPERLLKAIKGRKSLMAAEKADPYRHGFEPEIWRESDWRLAELRCTFPGMPLILGTLGGNGSSKSHYWAKRFDICMVENEDWYCLQLSFDQDGSREIAQRIVYDYLPVEEKNEETGKRKKTAATKLSYNVVNGFTDDTFGLENRCRANFKFYGGGDVKSLEGIRPDMVWADEMVPLEWVRAADRRLVTKAQQTHAIVPALKAALAARVEALREVDRLGFPEGSHARAELLLEVWKKWLRPILPKLFQGVCGVSFTPAKGYNDTVGLLTHHAHTLHEVEAELLPISREGVVMGHEKVPRVQYKVSERAVTLFFHIYDNPYGGNWEAQKKRLAGLSRAEKLWQAYGVATKTVGVQLSTFGRAAHVRPFRALPKRGCWYHTVDPCSDGRNWFMQWTKCAPNPVPKRERDALLFIAREWPQPKDYIVAGDVGNPGEWALLENNEPGQGRKQSARKADGYRGPAQRCWGLGFRQYAEEIERVELELGRREVELYKDEACVVMTDKGPRIVLQDGCRIMDSRAANTATQTHGESLTIRQIMEEYGLYFLSAGRDSGAEAGKTHVKEGVGMLLDRLSYDPTQAELDPVSGLYKFHGAAPSLLVCDECENTIFCWGIWTGQDGGEGASKDPVDTGRYLVIANPEPVTEAELLPFGGGSY